jgi:hypothetical protein
MGLHALMRFQIGEQTEGAISRFESGRPNHGPSRPLEARSDGFRRGLSHRSQSGGSSFERRKKRLLRRHNRIRIIRNGRSSRKGEEVPPSPRGYFFNHVRMAVTLWLLSEKEHRFRTPSRISRKLPDRTAGHDPRRH